MRRSNQTSEKGQRTPTEFTVTLHQIGHQTRQRLYRAC